MTRYLLSLLQELCWPISHPGNVGNGNQDHICDGDTRKQVQRIFKCHMEIIQQAVVCVCAFEGSSHVRSMSMHKVII